MTTQSLWIPGPTEVRPELLAECARPMIGHRFPEMGELLERIDPGLRLAFGLADDSTAHVAVHSCTASGLMESVLRGVTGRVLALINGSFSKRFADVAESLGLEVVRATQPMGASFETAEIAALIERDGPFEVVTVCASETSTGTATPPARVAAALEAHPDTLLFVDCVTWLGGAPIDLDANRIDAALAGTQKALALPPGLGLLGVSERFVERARSAPRRGWFLDPVKLVETHAARKPPMTPTISLHYALARQLEEITSGELEGRLAEIDRPSAGAPAWRARFDRHARMRDRALAWASERGLRHTSAPEHVSPTVSSIDAGGRDVPGFLAHMREAGFRMGGGYGDLKKTAFRIGHMGDHTESELETLLTAADAGLGFAP